MHGVPLPPRRRAVLAKALAHCGLRREILGRVPRLAVAYESLAKEQTWRGFPQANALLSGGIVMDELE